MSYPSSEGRSPGHRAGVSDAIVEDAHSFVSPVRNIAHEMRPAELLQCMLLLAMQAIISASMGESRKKRQQKAYLPVSQRKSRLPVRKRTRAYRLKQELH